MCLIFSEAAEDDKIPQTKTACHSFFGKIWNICLSVFTVYPLLGLIIIVTHHNLLHTFNLLSILPGTIL